MGNHSSKLCIAGDDILLIKSLIDRTSIAEILLDFSGKASLLETDIAYFSDPSSRPWIAYTKSLPVTATLEAYVQIAIDLARTYYEHLDVRLGSPFRYNEYGTGHGYKLHVDRSNNASHLRVREVSVVVGLNDDYTGGELSFPRQKTDVKVGAGDILMFPSCYTHPHEVAPVSSGVRKTVVTWLS